MADNGDDRGAAAVFDKRDVDDVGRPGWMHYLPGFGYILIGFILVELGVGWFAGDVRAVIFNVGGYAITYVEIFYLAAAFAGLLEMFKISRPGINNSVEVGWMFGIAVAYLILFIFGANDLRIVWLFRAPIFATSEFFWLMILAWLTAFMGFLINTRTYGRSITDTR